MKKIVIVQFAHEKVHTQTIPITATATGEKYNTYDCDPMRKGVIM